jgi:hypothetical protein
MPVRDTFAREIELAGHALLSAGQLLAAAQIGAEALNAIAASWEHLPRDAYLRDGGRYRYRRHGCFVQSAPLDESSAVARVPHRAHWQPTDYNALHGGLERWFEPIDESIVHQPVWSHLLGGLGSVFARVKPVDRWYIEAHQFRIDTAEGIGRPTPEGAHRDGVDFVAVILVQRRAVRGGETRVFQADGNLGVRFTMTEPWTALLLDDHRVVHETTPIQPDEEAGVRDTLVLTYRAAGFQAPDQPAA